jgi:hypothetical protein
LHKTRVDSYVATNVAEQHAASIIETLSYTLDRQIKVLRNLIARVPIHDLIFHKIGTAYIILI